MKKYEDSMVNLEGKFILAGTNPIDIRNELQEVEYIYARESGIPQCTVINFELQNSATSLFHKRV